MKTKLTGMDGRRAESPDGNHGEAFPPMWGAPRWQASGWEEDSFHIISSTALSPYPHVDVGRI